MQVGQCNFRNVITAQDDGSSHAQGHDDEADTEYGINLADDLVDGNKGCDEIINQYHCQPEFGIQYIRSQHGKQVGRSCGEAYAHQHQKNHGEYTHDLFHGIAQICTCKLGHAGPLVAHGHHAHHVVMDASA